MPFGDEFDCAEEPATAVRDSTGRCESRQRMECASAALALSEFAFALFRIVRKHVGMGAIPEERWQATRTPNASATPNPRE